MRHVQAHTARLREQWGTFFFFCVICKKKQQPRIAGVLASNPNGCLFDEFGFIGCVKATQDPIRENDKAFFNSGFNGLKLFLDLAVLKHLPLPFWFVFRLGPQQTLNPG